MADIKARCRGPLGDRRHVALVVTGDAPATWTGLPMRTVEQDGQPLLMVWLPADRPELLDRLDREVRAGVRFAQVFQGPQYPTGLPRLVAYDMDGEEPFALLEPYRGVPTDLVGLLTMDERARFQESVLRAALHSVHAGMVHGAICPRTVHWDADTRSAQLVDFGNSARITLPVPAGWPHIGVVDRRADVRPLGELIRQVILGQGGSAPTGVAGDPEHLRQLLDGVFVDPPAGPPDIAQLLTRLRADTTVRVADLGAELAPGLMAFDQALARKRGRHRTGPAPGPHQPRPTPGPAGGRPRPAPTGPVTPTSPSGRRRWFGRSHEEGRP